MKNRRLTAQQLKNVRELIDTFEYPMKLEALLVSVAEDLRLSSELLKGTGAKNTANHLMKRVAEIEALVGEDE